ncbi:MAG TPA: hypothetical protein VGN63_18385 [Flavisolibacter sp.]|jgi:hypothetical protein|nr:hypothetical protein [Flavisolibacter sp.]
MQRKKSFWIGLSLLNLCLIALFGLLMRSKILFPIPFLDYRNLLSAHSHFAFGGWAGLALLTLLIYDVLPAEKGRKKIYQAVLWGIETSSLGMAFSFPFWGYTAVSIGFSTLYILITYVFGWVFWKDILRQQIHPAVKLTSLGAVASLLLSAIGPAILSYILLTNSTNSLLYRDAIYTFLHFQYNGFFTLTIFATLFSSWLKKRGTLPPAAKRFTVFLLLSLVPSLCLALLWHNMTIFYVLGALGCLCILLGVFFFIPLCRESSRNGHFSQPTARLLWTAAAISFVLKMILTIGTIYPPLGNAVYGARPVIIGFLHLVFLGFVSFFILSTAIEDGFFNRHRKTIVWPFYLFGFGVLFNEAFLMIQGLEILLKTNSPIYYWLLWIGAILLFLGALAMSYAFYAIHRANKKAVASATAPS